MHNRQPDKPTNPIKRFSDAVHGLSFRILLTYFSILLIPLIAILIIYNTSINALLVHQEEQTMYGLEKTAELVQVQLEELQNINSYIHSNPSVNSIINHAKRNKHLAPTDKRDIFMVRSALESFPSYNLTNILIKDTYIFFREIEYTAKLPAAFVDNENAYNSNVNFHGLSYDAFNALCDMNFSNLLLVTGNGEGRDLLLMRKVSDSDTVIVIQINMPALISILETNDTGEQGSTFILNSQHDVLAYSGDVAVPKEQLHQLASNKENSYSEIEINGDTYLSYVYPYRGLTYISLTEKHYLTAKISSIKYVIIAIASVAFILGIVLVTMLWSRRRHMILNVQRTAQNLGILSAPPRSENQLLERTLNALTDTMASLQEEVKQQRDILTDTLLRKLVSHGFESDYELNRELEGSGLVLDAAYYNLIQVIPVHPDESNSDKQQLLPYRIFLKQFLQERLGVRNHIFDLDNNSFLVLLLLDEAHSTEDLKAQCMSLYRELEEMDWFAPSFVITDSCDAVIDVVKLMPQLEIIDEYLACTDTLGVFTINDLPQTNDTLYFPITEEMQLQRILNSGTIDELEDFWYRMLQENILHRKLRVEMLVELRDRLRLSIMRALSESLDESQYQKLAQKIQNTKSIQVLYNYAEQAMYLLNECNAQSDDAETERTKQRLQEVIDRRLSDSSFNLSMLADEVGIPENVLYRNFKNYFGQSFSSYLEQCRINKAFDLLREQVLVKDVAMMVGYTSDHSFRRAFKRIMKVPPSQFQEA